MRTLEQIQADISFLLHEKESFFSKLFHSNSQRIKDLRIDEKKAIDKWLYESDSQYKDLSDENTALLANTHWNLKIIDYDNAGRNAYYTNHIEATLEIKGFLHGKGSTYYLIPPDRSTEFSHINPLGELKLYEVEQFLKYRALPKFFECYTDWNGRVAIEKSVQEYLVFYDKIIIKDVIGDPFNGNSFKRNAFLSNRALMLEFIKKHRIGT